MSIDIDLSRHAVLASVHVPSIPARKLDRGTTEETLARKGAHKEMGAFTKALFSKDAVKAVVSAAAEVRSVHVKYSLPWPVGQGVRMVPLRRLDVYREAVRKTIANYHREVERFTEPDTYNLYVREAQRRLGVLFNPNDYPPPDKLREKLRAEVKLSTVPSGNEVERLLGGVVESEVREAVASSISDTTAEALEESVRELVAEARQRTEALDTYVNGEGRRLHESHLRTLERVMGMIKALPLPDGHRLTRMAEEAHGAISRLLAELSSTEAVKAAKGSQTQAARTVADAAEMLRRIDDELGV